MVCVAVFFGGRYSVLQGESLEETLNAKAVAKAAREALEDYKRRRTVVRVLKGNRVFVVENDLLTEVQVANIYCPSPDRPFGQKAIDFTTNFCLRQHVKLPSNRLDGFGRRFTDIVVNRCSLREELLNAGLAWQAFEFSDSQLAKIQREAKALKRGLWAEVDTAPWAWREPIPDTKGTPIY